MSKLYQILSDKSEETAEIIKREIANAKIDLAITLGSGLSDLTSKLEDAVVIDYSKLPAFPDLTVAGHSGQLFFGRWGANNVMMLKGRSHYYEKGDILAMRGALASLAACSVPKLLLTNAAGGVADFAKPGEIVMLSDHISFTGVSPLFNVPTNDRFVDLGNAYSKNLQAKFHQVANCISVPLHSGVYGWFCGPHFETAAEIQMAKILNCSMIGMSTAPEVILANFLKIETAAISLITNYAAGLSDEVLSHEHTLNNIVAGREKVTAILDKMLAHKL